MSKRLGGTRWVITAGVRQYLYRLAAHELKHVHSRPFLTNRTAQQLISCPYVTMTTEQHYWARTATFTPLGKQHIIPLYTRYQLRVAHRNAPRKAATNAITDINRAVYKLRTRLRRVLTVDATMVPDMVQRCHELLVVLDAARLPIDEYLQAKKIHTKVSPDEVLVKIVADTLVGGNSAES